MPAAATNGKILGVVGADFAISTDSGSTWTSIGQVTKLSGGGVSRNLAPANHLNSSNNMEESVPAKTVYKPVTAAYHYDPTNIATVKGYVENGTKLGIKLTLGDGATIAYAAAYLTDFEPTGEVNDTAVAEGTLTFTPQSTYTFTAGS